MRAVGTLDNLSVTGEAEVVGPIKSGSHDDGDGESVDVREQVDVFVRGGSKQKRVGDRPSL